MNCPICSTTVRVDSFKRPVQGDPREAIDEATPTPIRYRQRAECALGHQFVLENGSTLVATGGLMSKEFVQVLCVITPSGERGYALDHEGARTFMDKWRASLPPDLVAEHERIHTYGGVVQIGMLRDDFDKILLE
jgi:hypothetical protein